MNFYEKRNKKSVFSKKELASMLNVDEEKIKELENGKRSITGETLDEYMKLINTTKKEKDIQKLELLNWLKSINLKSLREEFGFGRQKDLSKKVGVQQSVICRLERNEIKDPSFLTLYKLHKFFTDDFNDFDILLLVMSTYVVYLTNFSIVDDKVDSLTVILYI